MQLDEAAHILGSADFFSICNLEQRRMLAFAGERRGLLSGETLFRAGDVTEGAYVLISGELLSSRSEPKDAKGVSITQPGAVIGELALIAKKPRRATVVAVTPADLLLVPRIAFSKLMQQYPEVAQRAASKIREDVGAYVTPLASAGEKISGRR
ncbi:MAG TPA: cyclic nucleotide-binding domain-containing protein [Devosia sp.]|nr:cyclic nucleotide-binding domain-containing protein [Devosia sp.]